VDKKEDEIKSKSCPLKNFDACIGSDCAFYDKLKLMDQDAEITDEIEISDFSYCSIAYLPFVFYELKTTSLQIERLEDRISKL
jgi:hypothetical protein